MKESENKFKKGEPIYLAYLKDDGTSLENVQNINVKNFILDKVQVDIKDYKKRIMEIENSENFERWVTEPENSLGFKP